MVQVVYPVADLVVQVAQAGQPSGEGWDRAPHLVVKVPPGQQTAQKYQERLMKLICTTVSPGSWQHQGGRGTLDYYPLGMSLVVNQTEAVQAEVAHLLAALRRNQDTEVAVEIYVVSVAEEFLQKFRLTSGNSAAVAKIDDVQVRHMLEAAQADVRSSTMQTPRLTVLNGQQALLKISPSVFVLSLDQWLDRHDAGAASRTGANQTGIKILVQPVVSADRCSVRVKLDASLTELKPSALSGREPTQPAFQTLRINKTLWVPDGRTAVLVWGQHTVAVPSKSDPWAEIASLIPLGDQFVRPQTPQWDTRTMLVLITPRIVICDEEERSAAQEQSVEDW
jgi:type II secretory pathway component GspD/PulD (secretin)